MKVFRSWTFCLGLTCLLVTLPLGCGDDPVEEPATTATGTTGDGTTAGGTTDAPTTSGGTTAGGTTAGGTTSGATTGGTTAGATTGGTTGATTGSTTGSEVECTAAIECTGLTAGTCEVVACLGGQCVLASATAGTPCTPAEASTDSCAIGGSCKDSACIAQYKPCDDNDACTDDTCVPATGECSFTAISGCGDECSTDGDCAAIVEAGSCTEPSCVEGVCATKNIEDGASCTESGWEADACVVAGLCKEGVCTAEPTNCDDGIDCTVDACDPATGCTNTEDPPGCIPECITSDDCIGVVELTDCKASACVSGACEAVAVDDGTACTKADWEANLCIEAGSCSAGSCVPQVKICDDALDCTEDSCDPEFGTCQHVPDGDDCGVACEEDTDCLPTEYCDKGLVSFIGSNICAPKKADAVACTATNQCASEACGGCINIANVVSAGWCYTPGAKQVGELCKVNEECTSGSCTATCPLPGPGACECIVDTDCKAFQFCATGSFIGFGANGCENQKQECQSCTEANQCLSGTCDGGKCITLGASEVGAACCNSAQCASSQCVDAYCVECVAEDDCADGFTCINNACASKKGLGELCDNNDECATGQCEGLQASVCVCAEDSDCATGEYCNAIPAIKNECEPLIVECGDCSDNSQCVSGICDEGLIPGGSCVTPNSLAVDADCCSDSQCLSGDCDQGLVPGGEGTCVCTEDADCGTGYFCNKPLVGTHSCEPLVANCGDCDADSECLSGSCDEGLIPGGICVDPNDTDACYCSEDTDCGTGFYCDKALIASDVCQPLKLECEGCSEDKECSSGTCTNLSLIDGYCVTPGSLASGAACCDDEQCSSGNCTGDDICE